MVTGCSPILVVADLAETIRYYTEVLGFTASWMGGDPPDFGAASWGNVRIMFRLAPEVGAQTESGQIWIDVDDVDALYALHLERGALIFSPIEDKPWMIREYTVLDPNGYLLRFAGQPSHTPKGVGRLPVDVQILARMPTQEEFEHVAFSGFGHEESRSGSLDKTWRAVVAVDLDGAVIGILRIMRDAGKWFSIWDVAVLPKWQGQRIGTTMMQAALELVRAECPDANVYLFTYKSGFYEQLGFLNGSVHIKKV
jgi:ribosomal protein S18 acetylase RimI-like enzyme